MAVKKIEGGASLNQALAEAALTRVCAHKHVIGLLEMHQGASSGNVYLILEHCEATLARELLLSPRGLPLPRAKLLAYQLLQALEHLHVRQVCTGMCRAARQLAPQLLLDAPAPAFSLTPSIKGLSHFDSCRCCGRPRTFDTCLLDIALG